VKFTSEYKIQQQYESSAVRDMSNKNATAQRALAQQDQRQ